MTDEFKKARDEARISWATRIADTLFDKDGHRRDQIPKLGIKPFNQGADWAYEWLKPRWTKAFERNHAEIDKKQDIIDKLTEALEFFLMTSGQSYEQATKVICKKTLAEVKEMQNPNNNQY